jgi:copper chaperone CopZ
MTIVKRTFNVSGTSCESCSEIISKHTLRINGVKSIRVDHVTGDGRVTFDDSKTNMKEIFKAIEEKGYGCSDEKSNKSSGWIFLTVGIVVALYFILKLSDKIALPAISNNMSYGLLFLVGLLTGFHCVAMCGGFVVSYATKKKSYSSHAQYAVGKTISYTIIGAIFGLIGSIIAFTPMIRGVAGILAGLFLLIFGLNMLNIFPFLRKIRIGMPSGVSKYVGKQSNPLIIGLLNGLMIACGPLQAMYVMAAGTGSILEGAKLLFIF